MKKIILPHEARIQEQIRQAQRDKLRMPQVGPTGQPIQVPFEQLPLEVRRNLKFGIPVKDDACYLLYAICLYALDTEGFKEYPIVIQRLQEMRAGLENLYKLAEIFELEYKKFCIAVEKEATEDEKEVIEDETDTGCQEGVQGERQQEEE